MAGSGSNPVGRSEARWRAMNAKTMNKWLSQRRKRKKPRHCDMEGCSQATREGKPYCSDHVEELPYVLEVQQRIAAREDEQAEAAKRGARAIDPYGPTARDILLSLWVNGERSVARLAREMNLDFQLVQEYVKRLKKAKLIEQIPARRGAGKAKLTPELAAIEDPRLIGLRPPAPDASPALQTAQPIRPQGIGTKAS